MNVDSLLVERVAISDNGMVLVENGIEKFMPEQVILFFSEIIKFLYLSVGCNGKRIISGKNAPRRPNWLVGRDRVAK